MVSKNRNPTIKALQFTWEPKVLDPRLDLIGLKDTSGTTRGNLKCHFSIVVLPKCPTECVRKC